MSRSTGASAGGPNDDFTGLEGVGDELERLGDQVSGGRSGQPQNPTPAASGPGSGTDEPLTGAAAPTGEPGTVSEDFIQALGYKTDVDALEGVRNLRGYASATKDEATSLRLENDRLKAQLAGGYPPAAMPAAAPENDPLSTLAEQFFIPREALEPAVDLLVERKLGSMLAPVMAATQADQAMEQRYGPEYVRLKPQIEAFSASNPRVTAFVQEATSKGMPELAAEYKLSAFREEFAARVHDSIQRGAGAAEDAKLRGRETGAPLQSRDHTRQLLAERQAGGAGAIDMADAISRANRGDDRLIDEVFASRLPSEEQLEKVLRGGGL